MITLEQIRAARAMLGLKQHDLAKKAGISTGTLNNIERGVQTDPKISTIRSIQQALESAGIEFIDSEREGYGIRRKTVSQASVTTKLLIVDDSESDRLLYKTWLAKQLDVHYRIIEATNAKEGYESFIEHAPDCIILDFHMYGKNGFQLLVDMKKEHTRIPPIIFITSMQGDMIEKDAAAMGVHAYLNKTTLTKEKLYEAIRTALAK
jgi:CheY-like chemotaxis protein/DNA-binding XRE family transcriptional regulator